ncbi:MAG: VOC family protein [Xanthobacteraceae bacterium]|nr:VOC family protein [Xanthobacteraceae bacterium]MCW5676811.1 VOC family protein [Xanthobacteraceae bacterium]
MNDRLPDGFGLGLAALRVSDANRALDFYVNKVGLELLTRSDTAATLGAGGSEILRLDFRPGIAPRDYRETGLYHVAILLPDRASLGAVIARLAANDVKLGAADHLVSEAIYLWDPDNNGIEIYRDRPREEWEWRGDQVQMANRPLDFKGLLAEPEVEMLASKPMKAGTRIGHVHLEVDDLAKAKKFYGEVVGFAPTATLPGAQFLSAGRYHHHLGTNVWESRNGPPPSPATAGLSQMTFELPDENSIAALKARLESADFPASAQTDGFSFTDPWLTPVTVKLRT